MKTSVKPDNGVRYEPPKQGLERKRFCTDIPCCFIFLIFIILFAVLSFFAFQEGDPKQLLHPTDSQGNLCGSGNFLNQPYVYFFDWTKCVQASNIPVNMLKGRPFVCPTTQVCVQQCPNKTSYYKFGNYYANRICTYDVSATETDNEKLVNNQKCAPYIIASKPLFGRCIPEKIQSLINSIIQATDDNGVNKIVYDSSGQPLNGTKLGEGVKYLDDLLNLKQIGAFLVEDLTTSWKYILIALVFAAVLSFVWIVLMRWLAKPVVWLGILLFIFILAIIAGLSFYEFVQLRQKNDNQIAPEFKFVADAHYYRSLPITWLIIGILTSVLLLISILVFLALLKRLRIALAILKQASKAVGYNFFSLFWPFIPFLLQIGVFVYWAVVAIYLATSGKPIYRIAYNETIGNTTNVTLGGICDPKKWNTSSGLNGQCVFWEYGYDPQVDLDSILNGTGQHFESFIYFVNQHQWIPQVFSAFMLFWLTAFVIGFSQLVLAGIYARYYWDRERFGVPCSSLCASLFRALIFHLGTIAFGSLIIAIVKMIRGVLEYFEEKVKDKTGSVARCLFCCCRCCLFCLEKFLKFLNRNAYIITAIYGTGFCTSARRAFHLIVSNPLRLLVIDKVCDFLIFLGKLCVTAAIGILAFFFFTHRIAQAEKYVPELHYYFVPLLLIVIGTYIIATCFFSVYSMAVDTLFICAIQDIQLQEKIGENCVGFDDGPIQTTLSILVEIYIKQEDYTNALDYIIKQLDIQLKNSTTSAEDLATTYFNIGYINDCRQDYKKARINYQKALQYASSTHPNLGQIYYYLASIYNDYDAALEHYKNALKVLTNGDDLLASIYNNIGLIYRSKRNYAESLIYYNKALEIIADNNNLISTIYYNIAIVYDDKEDYKLALQFYKMALDTVFKNDEKDEDLLIKIYNNMAGIYKRRFQYQKGIIYCQKVLELQLNSATIMKDHAAMATTYSNLGTIYFLMCHYPSALQNYEKALEIVSKTLSSNHPHVIEYRDYIATTKRHIQYQE